MHCCLTGPDESVSRGRVQIGIMARGLIAKLLVLSVAYLALSDAFATADFDIEDDILLGGRRAVRALPAACRLLRSSYSVPCLHKDRTMSGEASGRIPVTRLCAPHCDG